MFEQKYIIMQTIGHNSQKMTSIVKTKNNNYYIAKKVLLNDEMTMHEIQVMKNLSHPNIIALHEIIEEQKWAYIIEQYCEEGDLQYHLRRQIKGKKLISEQIISRWLLQILLAMEYLHHLKIIHRDIRPKNIFLTSNGNIKLGSFKVSKLLEEQMNYAKTLINSPYYLTPQLTEGKAYDFKVDIWAFGCVTYQICSLKPPINLSNIGELLSKITKGKIEDLPYNYSKQLNILYQKCMKKNPAERISARQLLKSNYFLECMEKFIVDKGLNINIQDKIPIKRYNIHRSKYQRLKIKKKLIKQKIVQKKQGLLPKLQIQSSKIQKKECTNRQRSKEKKLQTQTPVVKRKSKSKHLSNEKISKCYSSDKKNSKQSPKLANQKLSKPPQIFIQEKYKVQPKAIQKEKKLQFAPPMLPKPMKKTQKANEPIQSERRAKTRINQQQVTEGFEMTMSKQDLGKQLSGFQKKQLQEINEGINKIFQNLKLKDEDQEEIQFDFEDEEELRLTCKKNNQAASLLKTCKSKLDQLIQEINYKYCPDMQRNNILRQQSHRRPPNLTPVLFQKSNLLLQADSKIDNFESSHKMMPLFFQFHMSDQSCLTFSLPLHLRLLNCITMDSTGWEAMSSLSSFIEQAQKRKQLKVFGQLDARLDYCEYLIRTETNKKDSERFKSKKRKKQLKSELVSALKSLNIEEITLYYNKLVQQMINLTYNVFSPPIMENTSFLICQAYSRTYSLKIWKKKKFRFDRENHIIYAEKDKKIKIYDLGNYIVRKVQHSDYFVLVLQAINSTPIQTNKSAYFGFQYKNTFAIWFGSIQKSVQIKQWQFLLISLNKQHLFNKQKQIRTVSHKRQVEWGRLNKTEGDFRQIQKGDNVQQRALQSVLDIPISNFQDEEEVIVVVSNYKSKVDKIDDKNVQQSSIVSEQNSFEFGCLIDNSFTHRLCNIKDSFASIQDLVYQLQLEEEQIRQKKKKISFAQSLINRYDINTLEIQNLQQFNLLQLIKQNQSVFNTYQNKSNKTNFRLICQFFNKHILINQEDILDYILNIQNFKKSNKGIKQFAIKTIIVSQNSTLNYQQHFPYNRLFRSRQFAYVRHVTKDKRNRISILNKSIPSEILIMVDPFSVRAELCSLLQIIKENGSIKLVGDYYIDNKGGITDAQNANIVKKDLIDFGLGLCSFIKGDKIQKKNIKYYNLNSHNQHSHAQLKQTQLCSQTNDKPDDVPQIPQSLNIKQQTKIQDSFIQITRNIYEDSVSQSILGDLNQIEKQQFLKISQPFRKTIDTKSSIQDNSIEKYTVTKIAQQPQEIKANWMIDWMINQEIGGLTQKRPTNYEQREILKKIIESIVKTTLMGKNIEKIGLPADICQPKSRLQSLIQSFSVVPELFKGSLTKSTFQRLLLVIKLSILLKLLSLHDKKSFQALLGETYQCKIGQNCEGYAQQLSVSPCTTALMIIGKEYIIQGTDYSTKQRQDISLRFVQMGLNGKIKFMDGLVIHFTTPVAIIQGLTSDKRTFVLEGKSCYWIQKQCMILQINFDSLSTFSRLVPEKSDIFSGTIYQTTQQYFQQSLLSGKKQKPPQNQIENNLGKIYGRWTTNITFQNFTLRLDDFILSSCIRQATLLPSDSRYRSDIAQLKENNLDVAQKIKEQLEERQQYQEYLRKGRKNLDS